MCEFCTQHGEGKKWYLNMENYSRDLFEQDGRREYMTHFINTFEQRIPHAAFATRELVFDRITEKDSLWAGGAD
jgi:hypothetical protein